MSIAEDLAQLSRMRSAGDLSKEEFAQAKAYVLEEYGADAQEETVNVVEPRRVRKKWLGLGLRPWIAIGFVVMFAISLANARTSQSEREALRQQDPAADASLIQQEEEAAAARIAAEREAAEVEAERARIREAQAEQARREEALAEERRLARKAQEEAEEKQAGFHCLSPWDAAHSGVVKWTKDRLNDPDSFQHVSTRITPVTQDGGHVLLMQYRAKNGFGGVVPGSVIATIRNSDCAITDAAFGN